MKIRFKVMTIVLMLIIIWNAEIFVGKSIAVQIESAYLYSKGNYDSGMVREGLRIYSDFVVYAKDGVEYPAYCLDKDVPGATVANPYSVSVTGLVTNAIVWRVITGGYSYKSAAELGCDNETQAYIATKQAVYCVLYDRDLNSYTAVTANGEKVLAAMKNIVTNARNSNASKPSAGILISAEDTKWKLDEISEKYISMTFYASSGGGMSQYSVEIEGNFPEGTLITDMNNNKKETFSSTEKFKILIPVINVREDGNFNINIKASVLTKPILYGTAPTSSLQDFALAASSYEDGQGTQKIYYTKNMTKIIILKQEAETQKPLQGVEFELLDENYNVLYNDLITDSDGKINIDNLLPGTYYIRETKTLDGYSLYNKLIEVKLDLNETLTVIVNNSEAGVTVEVENAKTVMEVENEASAISVRLPKTGR